MDLPMNPKTYKGLQTRTEPIKITYEKDFEKLIRSVADLTNVVTVQSDNLNKMYQSLVVLGTAVAELGKNQERLVNMIDKLSTNVEDLTKEQEANSARQDILENSLKVGC